MPNIAHGGAGMSRSLLLLMRFYFRWAYYATIIILLLEPFKGPLSFLESYCFCLKDTEYSQAMGISSL